MRNEKQFENYLSKDVPGISSPRAIKRRVYLAGLVECKLGIDLDDYMSEEKMRKLVEKIMQIDYKNHGMQNAVRHYYTFSTGRVFSRKR